MTAEALLEQQRQFRCELMRGEVRETAPAGMEHADIAGNIYFRLRGHVEPNRLGRVYTAEAGFLTARDPDTVRATDVAFVKADRLGSGRPKGYFPGAPDLAVELMSPNDSAEELHEKVAEHLDAGSTEVWGVRPKPTCITVHRPDHTARTRKAADTLTCPDLLPGFELTVRDIFG